MENGVPLPAAVIVEPVQGEGGIVPAPPSFLRRVREVTARLGIVMIVDCVQTGFGRTGKFFSIEHSGVAPDVIVMSKAVGGGTPLAVLAYQNKLDTWAIGAHAGTFRGNQLGLAAGTAAMRWSKEVDIPGQAARKGDYLRGALERLQARFPDHIGDVRGQGFMLGAELVDANSQPDKLGARAANTALAVDLKARLFQHGVIQESGGRWGSVMRFLPPVVITDSQLETLVDVFGTQLEAAIDAQHRQQK
eukprot:TRINITY_DN3793_c0_g1_i1.p2 TRINITY_DN3793_c0_g1~~TRINITY_DN3793_c0_g1_i1.p2  ORF type:complete len:248 (-),score=133.96 TRINITY_DN3793_c0_g1_i1:70-813(-)